VRPKISLVRAELTIPARLDSRVSEVIVFYISEI
jgi:hypothetical protein